MGSIFVTTTIAPSVATFVCMVFTWLKYGKPDVSMCLNASLAGLVAVTAPCDVCDAAGAAFVGAVSGVLVVFGVWVMDHVLHIDDPVGAVAVHMLNGIWGTLSVGLVATPAAPAFARGVTGGANQIAGAGLFYGGGFHQLGIQCVGLLATAAWTAVTITIAFWVIKKTVGLRASAEEEMEGLDKAEHGLPSAYDGFSFAPESVDYSQALAVSGDVPVSEAVPVQVEPSFIPPSPDPSAPRFTKVEIVCKESRLERLTRALMDLGVTGMTVSHVMGCGAQKGAPEYYRGVKMEATLLPKVQLDVVVSKIPVRSVIDAAKEALYTGHIGDGKIFVYNVENVVKVRTGEEGYAALQDVE